MPKWRKATWAIVLWTALAVVWIAVGIANTSAPANCGGLDQATCQGAYNVGVGAGITIIIFVWFLGFLVFGLIWLMSRPKDNVLVYGPQGQQVTVSEKEAKRRVDKQGWSYTPPVKRPS
jgi:hypothetical protein